jgi:gastrin-releasing peptide receptor
MIHQTITFVAITTLHLAFVPFTVDIYRTDAATWSQTQTTTDWQDHSNGTDYQQMVATNNPESFTNLTSTVHSQVNVSLEHLVSAFHTSSCIANCSDLQEQTDADKFHYISYDGEFPQELMRTAWEMYGKFNKLIKTALWFVCGGNETVGHDVISISRIYVHNFTEFMVRLNGSAATMGEVAVRDTLADLYRTSKQQVESVMGLVEHLTGMVSEEDKIDAMKRIMPQQWDSVEVFYNSSVLEISIGKQKELINLLQNISEKAGNMSEHTDGNPLINIITSGTMSCFVDAQYWTELIEQQTQVLVQYQTMLRVVQHKQFVFYTVAPVIVMIVLVMGITGNGLLLTIFVRHKETRTLANSMLINLTVVDLLSLVVNELLDYLLAIQPWPLGSLGCKLSHFFYSLLVAVSTYSVAIISVQRFAAVRQLPSLAWCHQSHKSKYVLIATVWVISCILSVPRALIANIDNKNKDCYTLPSEYKLPAYTGNLIVLCAVPLLITAVFSVLTAYRIRRSAREIPGEATGQHHLQHSRMVSSTVLFALTVFFVVSYAPFFLFQFIIFGVNISLPNWEYFWVYLITYHLRFLNCCLNPIVLFVTNKRFRGYIKKYCGQKEVELAISVEAAKKHTVSLSAL